MASNSLKVRNSLTLKPTTTPSSPENGDVYYDSGTNTFNFYQNGGWVNIPNSIVSTVGTIDSQAASANGLVISTVNIYAQSASITNPGMVNNTTQTMSGAKTFSTSVQSPAFITNTSIPATTGIFRLANTDTIQWRNFANSSNISLQVDANDALNFSGSAGFVLNGSASGAFTQKANNTTTPYSVKWPAAQSSGIQALQNDGSGNLSWASVVTAASYRSGTTSLINGTTSQAITFSSALASGSYSVVATMTNVSDSFPQFQPVVITAKSTTGFTATWNAPLNTASYQFEWVATLYN